MPGGLQRGVLLNGNRPAVGYRSHRALLRREQ